MFLIFFFSSAFGVLSFESDSTANLSASPTHMKIVPINENLTINVVVIIRPSAFVTTAIFPVNLFLFVDIFHLIASHYAGLEEKIHHEIECFFSNTCDQFGVTTFVVEKRTTKTQRTQRFLI